MNFINLARYSIYALTGAVAGFVGFSAYAVHHFSRRHNAAIVPIHSLEGAEVKNISLQAEDGEDLSGWLIEKDPQKVVIILSGRGNNRTYNIIKARHYLKRGYSVLMPDLRGTGNSSGHRITFGWNERKDLVAWYYYLQHKKFTYIAAHGHSMGAATICYSLPERLKFEFIVLESCYKNFSEVVENGLRSGHIPGVASRLIVPMGQSFLKYVTEEMRPGNYLKLTDAPLLVLGGDSELIVPAENTIDLFAMNHSRFSKIHFFKGGFHENFSTNYKEEYAEVLNGFLDRVEAINVDLMANDGEETSFRVVF